MINLLPTEVLCTIFHHLQLPPLHLVKLLLRACWHWYEVARADPRLWSRVVAKRWDTLVQKLQRMDQLGSAPIDLVVELNSWGSPTDAARLPILRDAASVLSSHIHHIQQLNISSQSTDWYEKFASQILGSRKAAILEDLQLSLGWSHMSHAFRIPSLSGCPVLVNLTSTNVPRIGEGFWTMNLRNLKLTLEVPLSQLIDVLSCTTVLRVLSLPSGARWDESYGPEDTPTLRFDLVMLQELHYVADKGLAAASTTVRQRSIQWRELSESIPQFRFLRTLNLCYTWKKPFVSPEEVFGGSTADAHAQLHVLYLRLDDLTTGHSSASRASNACVAAVDLNSRRRVFGTSTEALKDWGIRHQRGFSSLRRLAFAAKHWDDICDILGESAREGLDHLSSAMLVVGSCIARDRQVRDGLQVLIDRPAIRTILFPISQPSPEYVNETYSISAHNLQELTIARGAFVPSSVEGIMSAQLHPSTALKLIRRFNCTNDGRKLPRLRLINIRLALYDDEGEGAMSVLRQYVQEISEVKQFVDLTNFFVPGYAFDDNE